MRPFLLVLLVLSSMSAKAQQLWSEKLDWLEDPQSYATRKYLSEARVQTTAILSRSANYEKMRSQIKQILNRPTLIQETRLQNNRVLRLKDYGLNQKTALELTSGSGNTQEVFSNLNLQKDKSYNLNGFVVSPNEEWVATYSNPNGSIDQNLILVQNLKDFKVVAELTAADGTPLWIGKDLLFFSPALKQGIYEKWRWSLLSGLSKETKITGIYNCSYGACLVSTETQYLVLDQLTSETLFTLDQKKSDQSKFNFSNLLYQKDHKYFLLEERQKDVTSVLAIQLQEDRKVLEIKIILVNQRESVKNIITSIAANDQYIATLSRWGAEQKLQIFDAKLGTLVQSLALESFYSATSLKESNSSDIFYLFASGILSSTKKISYSVANNSLNMDPRKLFMRSDSLQLESTVAQATSADGTLLPVQIFKKKGLKTADYGALIFVYGGFNVSSYFFPSYMPTYEPYLQNGGLLVLPMVRGGDEFGDKWHEAAVKLNKKTTFDDVAAVSKFLTSEYQIPSKKIILLGGSNGGLTAGATALLYPDLFGLSVPVNGVLDLFAKERLNPQYGMGWSYEYGNSREEEFKNFFKTISPVELAGAGTGPTPKFLVLSGQDDSRVHPAHSRKLIEALKTNRPSQAQDYVLSPIYHAGHWQLRPKYQDWISWRANVVLWSFVFDHLDGLVKKDEP